MRMQSKLNYSRGSGRLRPALFLLRRGTPWNQLPGTPS